MTQNTITELSIKSLTAKFGSLKKLVELSILGVKSVKDVNALKELIISKINNEISNYNLLSAKMTDIGLIFNKQCLEAKIRINISKDEITNELHGIFDITNQSDFIMFLYGLCAEHNNTSKTMTIKPPFYTSDTISKNGDVLTLYLCVYIV